MNLISIKIVLIVYYDIHISGTCRRVLLVLENLWKNVSRRNIMLHNDIVDMQ